MDVDCQTLIAYAKVLWPLVSVLIGLPTLDEVASGRVLVARPVLVPPAEFAQHVDRLKLTERALEKGAWPTLLTYVFLHSDFTHMISNVETLVTHGIFAFAELGPVGLYGVFFACGAASGLNRRGRELQTKSQLESSIPRAPERIFSLATPEGARNWWESARSGFATKAAPVLLKRVDFVGASGAISGLMGYGFASTLLRLASEQQAAAEAGGQRVQAWTVKSVETWARVVNLLQSGAFLLQEWRLASGEEGLTSVDHSAHLTGFVAGACFSLVSHWLHHLRKLNSRPASRSSGHRLGRRGE